MSGGKAVHLLDCDRGCRVAIGLHDKFEPERKSVEIEQFYEADVNSSAQYLKLKQRILEIPNLVAAGKYPYKVLVVDSLTSLADYALRYCRRMFGTTAGGKEMDGRMIYGRALDELQLLLSVLKYVPIATILIGHVQKDQVDGITVTELACYGKNFPGTVTTLFDEVYYAKVVNTTGGGRDFVLQTVSTPSISARSRNCVPDNYSMSHGLKEAMRVLGYSM